MTTINSMYRVFGAALLFTTLTACGDNGGGGDTTSPTTNPTGTTTDGPATEPTTDPTTEPTSTTTTTTTNPTTMTDPTTEPTSTTTTTTTDPTTGPTTGEPDTTTGGGGFVFPDEPLDAYVQIDRHGAVEAGTAGILASQGLGFKMGSDIKLRDAYNASNPEEDKAGMWVPEIVKSIEFFHDALDDDIVGFKLVPATVDETVAQAGPVIIPDTIKYDPSMPSGYPNGRKLEDPVVDLTLAAVLLKLGPKQPLTTFSAIPLNPPANDVPFSAEWPYLAPPHPPK